MSWLKQVLFTSEPLTISSQRQWATSLETFLSVEVLGLLLQLYYSSNIITSFFNFSVYF